MISYTVWCVSSTSSNMISAAWCAFLISSFCWSEQSLRCWSKGSPWSPILCVAAMSDCFSGLRLFSAPCIVLCLFTTLHCVSCDRKYPLFGLCPVCLCVFSVVCFPCSLLHCVCFSGAALSCRVLGVGRPLVSHPSHPTLVCRVPKLPHTSYFSPTIFYATYLR